VQQQQEFFLLFIKFVDVKRVVAKWKGKKGSRTYCAEEQKRKGNGVFETVQSYG
jgi:hypothetical protein